MRKSQANAPAPTDAEPTDNGKIKDPANWTTGEEPMTGAQESYLHTLATKAGVEVEDDLTKAEASMMIDELRDETGTTTPTKAAPAPKAKKAATPRRKAKPAAE